MLRKIFILGLLLLVIVLLMAISTVGWCSGIIPLKVLCDDIYTIPSATPFEYETSGIINEFKIYDQNSNVINTYKLEFSLLDHIGVIKDYLEYDENGEVSDQLAYEDVREPTYKGVEFELLDKDNNIVETLEIGWDEKENKIPYYITDNFALVIKFDGNSALWLNSNKRYEGAALGIRYKDSDTGRELESDVLDRLTLHRFDGPINVRILTIQAPSRKILEEKIKELGLEVQ